MPEVDPDADLAPAPLPEPAMTEPFSIAEALYDPASVEQSVVSVLDLMRVGIYAADGTVIRRGDEADANDLWLTAEEVRGLIEMGVADAAVGDAENLPYTFADLASALSPLLPGWSAAKLAAAYQSAYQDHPEDVIPTVMLTQRIEPGTRLTRVQLWLLFVDGFLSPGKPTAVQPAAETGAPAFNWGTANAALPDLASPDPSLPSAEFPLFLSHLALAGWTIPFGIDPVLSGVQEGLDGPGPPLTVTARLDPGSGLQILTSPITGKKILEPLPNPTIGGSITWSSPDETVLADHGAVSGSFNVPVPLDSTGTTSIGYQVRQEPAGSVGDPVSEPADLRASIPLADLVPSVYTVPAGAQGFLFGSRQATGRIRVARHAGEGIRLNLINVYQVDVQADEFILGSSGGATFHGSDDAKGFLEKRADGTYRGVLTARSVGVFDGEFAGNKCSLAHNGTQLLYVVGVPVASGKLNLRFYPQTMPTGDFVSNGCTPADRNGRRVNQPQLIGFDGGGPDNRPAGSYLPFGNAAWNSPEVGYTVLIPTSPAAPQAYTDLPDTAGHGIVIWYVRTTLVR